MGTIMHRPAFLSFIAAVSTAVLLGGCSVIMPIYVINHGTEPAAVIVTFVTAAAADRALASADAPAVVEGAEHPHANLGPDLPWNTLAVVRTDTATVAITIPPASTVWLTSERNGTSHLRRVRMGDCELMSGSDCSAVGYLPGFLWPKAMTIDLNRKDP